MVSHFVLGAEFVCHEESDYNLQTQRKLRLLFYQFSRVIFLSHLQCYSFHIDSILYAKDFEFSSKVR